MLARVRATATRAHLDTVEAAWKYQPVRLGIASWLACSIVSGCLPEADDLASYSNDWSPKLVVGGGASAAGASGRSGSTSPGSGGSAPEQSSSGGRADGETQIAPTFVGAGGSTATAPSSSAGGAAGGSAEQATADPALGACADGVLDGAQSTCYLVGAVPTNWQAARAICEQWQGALVKIESAAEDKFVGDLVTLGTWIGASDTQTENVFIWTDGSPITFGNWGPAQPDAFPGPDCIEKRVTVGGAWYDQPCFNARLYVCEKPLE
jgi:lectin-like protein